MFAKPCANSVLRALSQRSYTPLSLRAFEKLDQVQEPKRTAAIRLSKGAFDRDHDANELKSQLAGNRLFGGVCRKLGRSADKLGPKQDRRSALRIRLRRLSQIAAKPQAGRDLRARKLPARTLYRRPSISCRHRRLSKWTEKAIGRLSAWSHRQAHEPSEARRAGQIHGERTEATRRYTETSSRSKATEVRLKDRILNIGYRLMPILHSSSTVRVIL